LSDWLNLSCEKNGLVPDYRPRVLVVTDDEPWKNLCVTAFVGDKCDVETAENAFDALDSLRGLFRDIVVADDSCPDMEPMEFMFNVRDMTSNDPVILLGGEHLESYKNALKKWKVFFVGQKMRLLSMIPASVEIVRLRIENSDGALGMREPG
jgi:DNA-binding NtrC family response regulator